MMSATCGDPRPVQIQTSTDVVQPALAVRRIWRFYCHACMAAPCTQHNAHSITQLLFSTALLLIDPDGTTTPYTPAQEHTVLLHPLLHSSVSRCMLPKLLLLLRCGCYRHTPMRYKEHAQQAKRALHIQRLGAKPAVHVHKESQCRPSVWLVVAVCLLIAVL
jgi:hypothetical protein